MQDQMANMQPSTGEVPLEREEAEIGLTPEILQRMQEIAKTLSGGRKKRQFPGLAPVADVKKFECAGSHPVHQSTAPGILCVDMHKTDDSRVVTGGVDSQVILFDSDKEKLVQKLTGHSKKV